MPFNGSGTYNPPSAPTWPAVPNTLIESADYNSVISDLATALSNCMTRDGQSPCTANIPLGGFKITGLAAGVASTDGVNVSQAAILRGSIGASDWDNLLNLGIYEASAASLTGPAANFPNTSDIGQLLVLPQGSVTVQTYYTSTRQWSRAKVGSTWSSWEGNTQVILSDLQLDVPTDYTTFNDAFAFLEEKWISPAATVTVALVADTNINSWPAQVLDHPQSERIQIKSVGGGFALTETGGAPPHPFITLPNGIGLIDNLLIECNPVMAAGTATCLSVTGGNSVFGSGFFIVGFRTGLSVEGASTSVNWTGLDFPLVVGTIQDCSVLGLTVTNGARFLGTSFSCIGCGVGMAFTFGARGVMTACYSQSNTGDGLTVTAGANVVMVSSILDGNSDGAQVGTGGILQLINTISRNNAAFGLRVDSDVDFPFVSTFTGWSGNGSGNTAGSLKLMADHSAIGAETITGYITVNDIDGVPRKLAVVS